MIIPNGRYGHDEFNHTTSMRVKRRYGLCYGHSIPIQSGPDYKTSQSSNQSVDHTIRKTL